MVGKHNSVRSKLQDIVPHLITVKCICHSLHLACETLPSEIEYIIRETNMWFLKIYRLIAHRNPVKIGKLSGTRWLAKICSHRK